MSKTRQKNIVFGLLLGVISVFSIGCNSWTPSERQAFGWMIMGQSTDLLTTEYALDTGFKEVNPMLGDYPSDTEVGLFKIGTCLVFVGLGEVFPEYREDLFKAGAISGFVCGGINLYSVIEQ